MEIFNGDCLDIMKTLPDKSVDLFICDLPYGCLSRSSIGKTAEKKKCFSGNSTGCDWDVKIDLVKFWEQVKRLCKNDHTPILMFCNTKFGYELINSNPSWFRYDLVWNKIYGVGFLSANKQPLRSHEMIYVFSKKGAFYKRIDIIGDFPEWSVGKNGVRTGNYADKGLPKQNIHGGDGTRCVKSIIETKGERSNQKGDKKENKHPTAKPKELYKWLIERYSNEGDTILDPTAGSFNSVFVANELKRKAIGIEKDKGFYDTFKEKIKIT